MWKSGELDLLVWVDATSRAAIVDRPTPRRRSTAMGIDPEGDAEPLATRFVGWLAETSRSLAGRA